MAKAAKLIDEEQVTAYIQNLEPGLREIIQRLREIILASNPEVGERIKWNNPSFYYTCEIKDFDPKEYKREIIVFNLFKGRIMQVFPNGAKLDDTTGFLEGDYKDGRRIHVFKDMDEVQARAGILQDIVRQWLTFVEK